MKVYESAYTYFPFLYMYVVASAFGSLYHNPSLVLYQPYVVLVFMLINSAVNFMHDRGGTAIKHTVHRHIWKTVTISIFGILMNNIHTEMFRDFHFSGGSGNINLVVSAVYMTSMFITVYYFKNNSAAVMVHIVFAFFPLRRVWQVNLYMYIVYTTLAVILMYRRIRVSALDGPAVEIQVAPVIKFFMYLRLHDYLIVFGAVQIYLEYFQSVIPELEAVQHISEIMSIEREKRNVDV